MFRSNFTVSYGLRFSGICVFNLNQSINQSLEDKIEGKLNKILFLIKDHKQKYMLVARPAVCWVFSKYFPNFCPFSLTLSH